MSLSSLVQDLRRIEDDRQMEQFAPVEELFSRRPFDREVLAHIL
jgi:hypothetical protein